MPSHSFKTPWPGGGNAEVMDTNTPQAGTPSTGTPQAGTLQTGRTPQASPRPDHSVWPAIFADDPLALRAWLVGLGFEEGVVVPGAEPGTIHHSELLWPEGGRVMVASRATKSAEWPGVDRSSLYVVTDNPARVHERALAAAAQVTRPLKNEDDYASQGFSCTDPEGNHWSFGTYAG